MRRSLVALVLAVAGCLGSAGPDDAVVQQGATSTSAALEHADDLPPAVPVTTAGGVRTMAPGEGPRPFAAGDAPLTLAFTIDTASADPARDFEAFDAHSLNVADLDGDGRREIISMNDNKRVYVLSGDTGTVLAELETRRPDGDAWPARDINGVAVGDLTGDGRPELAIVNSAATLTVLTLDRDASTRERFAFDVLWENEVSVVDVDPDFYKTHPWFKPGDKGLGADGNPFIVHLPDGTPIVLAQSDGSPAHIAFNGNGTVRWYTSWWDGNSGPWAGRLTPDGPVHALFATDNGHVVAYDARTGAIRWDFDARANGADPGSIPIMPAVVDLRGDGERAIVVGARVAVKDNGTDWMQRQNAKYFLLDAAGKVVWQASFPWGNPLLYADPAVVDVDGDGVKDIVALDWNTIGHYPGNWEKTGPANLFALDGETGQALWHRQVDAQWSNTGIAVASFVPGAGPAVVTEEQRGGRDGLTFIGLDGARQGWMPLPDGGWGVRRGPALADLDGDGLVEVVVPVSRPGTGCPQVLDVGCRAGALLVYRSQASVASVLYDGNPLFSDMPATL